MMHIYTRYYTTSTGRGRVRAATASRAAKGRSFPWEFDRSAADNHKAAALALAQANGYSHVTETSTGSNVFLATKE